jgi:hypothetical protein
MERNIKFYVRRLTISSNHLFVVSACSSAMRSVAGVSRYDLLQEANKLTAAIKGHLF